MQVVLTIIAWVVVVWLFGSVIYSTQFHLRAYLISKGRLKTRDTGEPYPRLLKQQNWWFLAEIQLLKLAIAVVLLLTFLL